MKLDTILKSAVLTISLLGFCLVFTKSSLADPPPDPVHITMVPIYVKEANTAETADYAENAGYAEEAGHASTADQAEAAKQAGHALEADHADTADHADIADSAITAGHANTANHADTADDAEYADRAGSADTADTLSPLSCSEGQILQKGVDKWYCVDPTFTMGLHAYDSAGQYLGVVVDHFNILIFIPGLNAFTYIPEYQFDSSGSHYEYGDIKPNVLQQFDGDDSVYMSFKSWLTRNRECDGSGNCTDVFRLSEEMHTVKTTWDGKNRFFYKANVINEADIPFTCPVTLPIVFRPYGPSSLP